jgi:hypothetical protein
MLRRLLDRLNPIRGLPQPMRRYLNLPRRLLLIWLVATLLLPVAVALLQRWGLIDLGAAPAEPKPGAVAEQSAETEPVETAAFSALAPAQAGETAAPLAESGQIEVSGAAGFTLVRRGERVTVSAAGQAPLELIGEDGGWRLRDGAGQVVYRLEAKSEEKGKIYDAAGNYRYRVKREDEDGPETCKLYDAAGNRLHRVKVKDDSANLYGAGEDRIYKVKLKNGVHEVRDEGKRTVATVRGSDSLKQAGLLALPLEVPLRVLIWSYCGG